MNKQVIFVTDPLCSWCWGMLPEMEKVKESLSGKIEFGLMMAGLQIGSRKLSEREKHQLKSIWTRVTQTTGQPISGKFPEDESFIYHSEIPCRAVKMFQLRKKDKLWAFFSRLQQSFYLEACNITNPSELSRIAEEFEIKATDFANDLHHPDIIAATRDDFETAKQTGAHALPTVLMDTGDGLKLISGGYTTADFLEEAIEYRLQQQEL